MQWSTLSFLPKMPEQHYMLSSWIQLSCSHITETPRCQLRDICHLPWSNNTSCSSATDLPNLHTHLAFSCSTNRAVLRSKGYTWPVIKGKIDSKWLVELHCLSCWETLIISQIINSIWSVEELVTHCNICTEILWILGRNRNFQLSQNNALHSSTALNPNLTHAASSCTSI